MNKVALFDLDHTLFTTNITFAFLKQLVLSRHISPKVAFYYPYYQLYKWGRVSSNTLWHTVFHRALKGLPLSLCQDVGNQVVEKLIHSKKNTLVWKALVSSMESKDHVCIASSSFDFLVKIVAKNLKLDSYIGTQCELDNFDCLLNLGEICNGYIKRTWISAIISECSTSLVTLTSYTDSIDDLPLLNISDTPICVSPDSLLRKKAIANQWRIID